MAMAPEQTGIGIRRHFTTEGIEPYDEVAWDRRDARITNFRDGSVAFEQTGVEVPANWSQNATNILAQKYFRGPLGAPEREQSLRQVVDRVADTIWRWGRKDGYFVDEAEAEAFRAELKHLVITQKAAFNSPVWFNIGVSGEPQQASACQPYDALVSTPDGLVPIGALVEQRAIGAKVFDSHGLTQVVAVKANGAKPVLRLHTTAGYVLDVTADHLVWRTEIGGERGSFVPAGDIRAGDCLEWHRTDAWGDGEISRDRVAEASLAGWIQAAGFVGEADPAPGGRGGAQRQAPTTAIECITVSDAERAWVLEALAAAFPSLRPDELVTGVDAGLDRRRIRVEGPEVASFVDRWALGGPAVDAGLPAPILSAALPVVAGYLRSLFQAVGFVSPRQRGCVSGLAMASEAMVRGVQAVLLRFGVYSRIRYVSDRRPSTPGCWVLNVGTAEVRRFAEEIGFISPDRSLELNRGVAAALGVVDSVPATRDVVVGLVEQLGVMEVYDIQTESGEYLSANLRVHNCFILAVDDTMQSILNWYVEEGTIFKGGSGAGVNLSTIRSSRETLKGGGLASGPVSFMRGADASAGTIKSGGKTRRAAKMVILNADHPDVEDFIWCKAVEERKARVLRDAGFDMDLDGRDSHSTQYQNANNSVRVTDEFMQAVVDDASWELRAVSTGEVLRTVKARDLFRQISQAAWECADPGMQFDTTINRWHTAATTGRINASNPCSEYMHLDNSACNLASLNLLKFLGDDGRFDVDGFKAAVEVVFTAQEILVGNADYPTARIAENSRRFRQLGLGYANLGAMLMALGLPYDSHEGRAWAGAITSLMTGHAYATSARTASRMGPFAGYMENKEPTNRVLEMHRDAAGELDDRLAPPELLAAARDGWDAAVGLGRLYGVRNSQASVLAPTGTIGLLMDCDTTGVEPDLSLCKMKKLVGGGTMTIVNQTVPRALRRLGYTGAQVADIVGYVDENKSIVGAPHLTAGHLPVFACSMGDNTIHYLGHVRMMGAVQPFISGAISKCVEGPTLITTADGLVRMGSLHDGEAPDTFRHDAREVASLGGYQKTDAFYYGGVRPTWEIALRSGHRLVGTPNHRVLVADPNGLDWKRLDEIEAGDHVAVQYGAELWSVLPALVAGFEPSTAYGCQKPVALPEEMTAELAFLLGAYASQGHTTQSDSTQSDATQSDWTVTIANSDSDVLRRVTDAWLSQFGLTARTVEQPGRCPGVVVSSKTVVEFLDYLGCGTRASERRIPDAVLRSPREMVLAFLEGLALGAYATVASAPKWAICLDSPRLLDDLQVVLTNLGVVHSRIGKELRSADDDAEGAALPAWLRTVLDDGLNFSPVDSVGFAGEREVFDISVPTTHAFVGNGIVNHNTINMPEAATVEDVERLHIEAWQLGLKAVAIYRDNCKVAQPLSTAKKDVAKATALVEATERLVQTVTARPVREKLPRVRASKTFSFRVADCHGYVTVGEYDDGRPGEIFLRVAKQGSTLAGIMDAFAISVSHGLQYGVPLKAFIEMYTNMRFEPAGITDDPDIRFASSLVDYIFRRMAVEYIPADERAEMGILTVGERMQPTLPGVEESAIPSSTGSDVVPDPLPRALVAPAPVVEPPTHPAPAVSDAPYCYQCGMPMQRAGACFVCSSCGTTSGCS